ncbi:MAG: MFS transporter [Xanthobacteraceae bacterium]|jgi:AAHS family 4-hydroxybenzoate transporter-like MFS transporter
MAAVVNVNETIDRHPITAYQIGVLVMCMLVALLDGYDTQAIGYTAPAIAQALNLPKDVLGPVFSAALLGAALGALSFGPLADRFGRKRFMVAATIIFGVFSLLTAYVTTLPQLLIYRFCAGLGLGGATPSFLALGGEFAPASKRGVFVAIAFAAWPFGGLIGALTSSYVIPHLGWQFVFYFGGVVPLIFAVILSIWLPESLRFLIARNIRFDEVRQTLSRIAPGEIPPDAQLVAAPEREREGIPVRHLFTEGRAATTVMLWVAFFVVFMVLVTVTAWTPTVLRSVGFSISAGALIIALNNAGSVCASVLSGFLVDRFGPYKTLVPGFIVGGVCIAAFGQATASVATLAVASTLAGFFVGGTGTGLIALAAAIYPTTVRSTGIGWGMGMGRLGQVFGPLGAGILVGWGVGAGGIFYAAAVPCFIGALFVLLLKYARGTKAAG